MKDAFCQFDLEDPKFPYLLIKYDCRSFPCPKVFLDAEFSLLENVEAKGQILQHEFARFDHLEDSYFQHKIGLINYAPYWSSMKMAVNRHPLWDFIALDSKTRN